MSWFPKIVRPCPVRDQLFEILDGDFCRECDQHVVNIDSLTRREWLATAASSERELCVRYKRTAPAVVAAIALGAAVLPANASTKADVAATASENTQSYDEIIVGGARRLTREERIEMRREARRLEQEERRAVRRAAIVSRTPPR